MKFLRLDLLTLLISLFILGSCKNQNDIGLPVGNDQLNGTLLVYDDITVKTDTDNVAVSSSTPGSAVSISKTPLSAFNDPILGENKANIATGLNLPSSTAYTVPTGTITTDSVVMELRYNDGFYGDSLSSRYRLNVQQLKSEVPLSSKTYFSNKVWEPENASLNDPSRAGAFNVRPKTRVRMFNIIKGARDTLRNVVPHLRIALNKTFIPNLLFNTPAAITSNTAFQNAVKGLYLTLQRNQTSETGGTLMLNLDSSRVNVYYRVVNAGVIDTAVVTLPFATHAGEVSNKTVNYANYPAAVQTAIKSTTSNNVVYLQGLAGLRAKVSFPNLQTMFGTTDINSIAINRAELVVTPVAGTDIPFVPQPQLTLYRLDITKQRTVLPDANGTSQGASDPRFFGVGAFGGNYLSARKEYHFLVTGYLQDLLKGRLTDYGTYLGTIDTLQRSSAVAIAPTIQTAGRVILVGSDKSPQRIKLNVIYTKNN